MNAGGRQLAARAGRENAWPIAAPACPPLIDDRATPAPTLPFIATEPGTRRSAQQWMQDVYARQRERDALFETISGEPVRPLYTAEDLAEHDPDRDLGFPGVYPFTRGVYPSMYRGRLWTMRQFAGFGTAPETNERFRYLLDHGQTGLSTAFDMPTLMGLDSDHPRSVGEVGVEGVAIDTLDDMADLFRGIPLGE